jgi:hypothetical protein
MRSLISLRRPIHTLIGRHRPGGLISVSELFMAERSGSAQPRFAETGIVKLGGTRVWVCHGARDRPARSIGVSTKQALNAPLSWHTERCRLATAGPPPAFPAPSA